MRVNKALPLVALLLLLAAGCRRGFDATAVCASKEKGVSITAGDAKFQAVRACTDGLVEDKYTCDQAGATVSFRFTPTSERANCLPICVVHFDSQAVTLDWRCKDGSNPDVGLGDVCRSASTGATITLAEAQVIASGACAEGSLQGAYACDSARGALSLAFSADEPRVGCDPVCIIDIDNKTGTLDWRCAPEGEGDPSAGQ
jgi:hypothetical protein